MYDANLVNFYSRVADYHGAHSKGYGHEAPGTLGRSVTYGLPKKRLRLRLMPFVFVAMTAFGLKAGILHAVGPAAYHAAGFTLVSREDIGEWSALVLKRN